MTETGLADQVARALEQAGLDVFLAHGIATGDDLQDMIWRALAESAALIAIVPSESPLASNIAVEVGAFKAWCKPIYVIQAARGNIKLPTYLSGCPVYPLSRVDDVVESIKRGLASLTESDCDILAAIYSEHGIPVDQLLTNPVAIEILADDFNARCGKKVVGERLVQELLRLRKSGRLSRRRG
jgi:hypothetical protein